MTESARTVIDYIKKLSEVGIALSAEKDNARLMELILESAKELTRADGGTLYSRTDDDELRFEIMLTDSLGIKLGGTSGEPIGLPNVPLFDANRQPNENMIAARAAVSGETVNIPDAYNSQEFDFSGTRAFDEKTGYRSTSFLTVPMSNHEDEVIGVLQLINARTTQDEVVTFTEEDQLLVRVPCVAGGYLADQEAPDRRAASSVRVLHRAHRGGDRRQVTVYRRPLPASAGADPDAGRRGGRLRQRPPRELHHDRGGPLRAADRGLAS